jgi:hypothetical protein
MKRTESRPGNHNPVRLTSVLPGADGRQPPLGTGAGQRAGAVPGGGPASAVPGDAQRYAEYPVIAWPRASAWISSVPS